MAKQTKGSSKKSRTTSKAKTKKTGKEVSDKALKSARGGIIIVGGRPRISASSLSTSLSTSLLRAR
jgi:hypothetical protein